MASAVWSVPEDEDERVAFFRESSVAEVAGLLQVHVAPV
jgi:hypothetical protein